VSGRIRHYKGKGAIPLPEMTIHIFHIHAKTGKKVWARRKLGTRRLARIANPEGATVDDLVAELKMSVAVSV
jgi:hypothetical protein